MPKIIKKRKNVIAQLLIVTVFSLWGFTSFGGAEAAAETVAPATSNINVNLSDGISIRVLDGTATTDLTDLAFDFTPTDAGASSTKMAVVEVGTSNETGYTLYMHSDWDDHDGNKTTSLVHTTGTVDDIIPTRLGSTYPFWYYHNAFFDEDKAIPAYGASEQLAINREAIDADRTVVPITVGVDTSVVSGTYRNKLVFTATSNPLTTDYELKFNANTEDAVTDVPETMTATVAAQSYAFTLPEDKPTRDGYGFAGWATTAEATEAEYQPGEEFTIVDSDIEGSSRTLYAVWRAPRTYTVQYMVNGGTGTTTNTVTEETAELPVSVALEMQNIKRTSYGFAGWNTEADGSGMNYGPEEHIKISGDVVLYANWISSTGNIQFWNGCPDLVQGQVTALKDTRDSQVYAVAKLADGKCWMIENLRYMGAGSHSEAWSEVATDKQYNYNHLTGSWTSSGYDAIYLYGAYYSWAAAIDNADAHTTRYGNPDSLTASTRGICPYGWRLPRSYYNGAYKDFVQADFAALNNILNGNYNTDDYDGKWLAYPVNMVNSGTVNSIGDRSWWRSDYSYLWSSTNGYYVLKSGEVQDIAYALQRYKSGRFLIPASIERKYLGYPVRCIKT